LKKITRILLITLGTFSVALGVIGMFLPLLPTTVFLLLAAFFYARSSERFYNWLITNRWFGAYILNYREGRGVSLKQKVFTILLLWLTMGYTVGFIVSQWWLKIILLGIASAVTLHLVTLKTYKPEPQNVK